MKTTISLVTAKPTVAQPFVAQPFATQLATTQLAVAAQPAIVKPVTTQPIVVDGCSNHPKGCVGVSVSPTVDAEKSFLPFSSPATANPVVTLSLSTSSITPVFFNATENQE